MQHGVAVLCGMPSPAVQHACLVCCICINSMFSLCRRVGMLHTQCVRVGGKARFLEGAVAWLHEVRRRAHACA